jgi:hypothetical protein
MARTRTLNNGAATAGCEAQLWQMAEGLRRSMDAAEHKHVSLGELIDTISNIKVGDEASRAKGVRGPVCEYFLSNRLKDDKRWQYGVPPADRPSLPSA